MVGLLPSSHVGLESAIGVFYTYVHLKSVAEQHKNEILYNKVSTMLDKHSKKLANTIFDYCAITTYGEARHGIDKAINIFLHILHQLKIEKLLIERLYNTIHIHFYFY